MIVFRLSTSRFSHDLSGKGAEKYGGRWNSKGTPLVYTGQSIALCTIEIAVHTPLGNIPENYEIITLEFPKTLEIKELSSDELPPGWKSNPHSHATQEIGDLFIREGKYLVLKVPSASVEGESNFLINPQHKDIQKIKIKDITPFNFDERLFIR